MSRIRSHLLLTFLALFGLSYLIMAGRVVQVGLAAEQLNDRQIIDIKLRDDILTVQVHNAPLHEILQMISKADGFGLKLSGDLGTPVTDHFSLATGEAIKRLVGRNSLVMYFAASDRRGARQLTGVSVYGAYESVASGDEMVEMESLPPMESSPSSKDNIETGGGLAAPPDEVFGASPDDAYIEEICADDTRIEECRQAYQIYYGTYSTEDPEGGSKK